MGVFRLLLALVLFSILAIFFVQNSHVVDLHFRLTPAPVPTAPAGDGSMLPGGTVDGGAESILEKLSFDTSMPLFLVVLLSVVAGAIVGGLIGLADQFRLRSQLRKKEKAIKKLEGEVKTLRNLPLEEEGEEGFKA